MSSPFYLSTDLLKGWQGYVTVQADWGRVLRQAAGPSLHLETYAMRLQRAVAARVHALGGADDDLSFAVDTVLPFRVRSAIRHLKTEAVDANAFEGFLEMLAETAVEALEGSVNSAELADAVRDNTDALHSYLVAHRLVSGDYLSEERRFVARILGTPQRQRPATGAPVNNAAKSDLVLAA